MKTHSKNSIFFTFVFLFSVSVTKAQQSQPDDLLLDLLIRKGQITQQEADSLRAAGAIKTQHENNKQSPLSLTAGKPLQLSGYIQGRYQVQDQAGKIDGGDIRRARVDLRGNITEKWDYRLQADFAGSPKLLDAIAAYQLNDYLRISAGQFKVPFSLENLTGSQRLAGIDRSQVVEALVSRGKDVIGNNNGRDIGVQLSGSFIKINGSYLFDYSAGVFDGAGINSADNNENKDIAGRLTLHPLIGLNLSANIYDGVGRWASSATAPVADHGRTRFGIDGQYINGPLLLAAEYIKGKDAAVKKEGWYAQAAVFVLPQKLQLLAKYDSFDPNLSISEDISTWYVAGAGILFNKRAGLQLNYTFKNESGHEINNNLFSAQLQIQF